MEGVEVLGIYVAGLIKSSSLVLKIWGESDLTHIECDKLSEMLKTGLKTRMLASTICIAS